MVEEIALESKIIFFERMIHSLEDFHTPLPGNVCKTEGCGGEVFSKSYGLFCGKFQFDISRCQKCDRPYLNS